MTLQRENAVGPPPGAGPRVLVVEDEPRLAHLLRGYFAAEGFGVAVAYDGPAALQQARTDPPDLIVLDIMLPGLDGLEVCRRLRQFSDAYVLMLTARVEEIDKLIGLSVGADDYLTKPFSPRELIARAKAMLRRPRTGTPPGGDPEPLPPLLFPGLRIDRGRHEVRQRGAPVNLTPREYDLLVLLATHPGWVFTRNQLLNRIWGDEGYDDHLVEVHINNLRRKLHESPAAPGCIETVRGVGYRWGLRPAASPAPGS